MTSHAASKLADFLTKEAGSTGRIKLTEDFNRRAQDHMQGPVSHLTAELKEQGFYSIEDGCLVLAKKPPSGRTNRQGRKIPTPNVRYEDTENHGMHLNKILNSRALKEYPQAQHVALALSRDMWLGHYNRSTGIDGFGKPKEATLDYIMSLTGLGEKAATKAIRVMVEAGFFRRIDNGNGGRNGSNRATYVPTLPLV